MSGSRREEAAEALRRQRQAAAEVANDAANKDAERKAAFWALPESVAQQQAVSQAALDWADGMGLEVRGLEIRRGFGYDNGRGSEWYASFGGADPSDHDFVERFHVCVGSTGETRAYMAYDPDRYDDGHPTHRITCDADLGAALLRADAYKHRFHHHR